jgi:glycine cleavage system H protein
VIIMKYTEEHEWLRLEGNFVVVGITDHASTELGDIVFVELPSVGTTVAKDGEVVVIESVKAASDILAPIDGKIVEVNEALVDEPSMINDDPTGNGWMFKMEANDLSQLDDFMSEAEYMKFIA